MRNEVGADSQATEPGVDWETLDEESRQWLSGTLDGSGLSADREESRLAPLLSMALAAGASDLHLSADCVPHMRVAGRLRPIANELATDRDDLRQFLLGTLSENDRSRLLSTGDLDTAIEFRTGQTAARLRANYFLQSGTLAAAFRIIPAEVPDLDGLGLPRVMTALAGCTSGLVLVTGATGSGKSTTVAAMLDRINREDARHIVTIEDPIEFRHISQSSIVQQRQVGKDTESFASGLRQALRQDPDVILLGELRDLETIRTALTAAETGHVVLATLHSTDTAGAIHRIIDVFPADQQAQIRSQLALSLRGIASQQLISFGESVVPAVEVLIATDAVRNLIREEKTHQLMSVIETSAELGMQSMGQARAQLGLGKPGQYRS